MRMHSFLANQKHNFFMYIINIKLLPNHGIAYTNLLHN